MVVFEVNPRAGQQLQRGGVLRLGRQDAAGFTGGAGRVAKSAEQYLAQCQAGHGAGGLRLEHATHLGLGGEKLAELGVCHRQAEPCVHVVRCQVQCFPIGVPSLDVPPGGHVQITGGSVEVGDAQPGGDSLSIDRKRFARLAGPIERLTERCMNKGDIRQGRQTGPHVLDGNFGLPIGRSEKADRQVYPCRRRWFRVSRVVEEFLACGGALFCGCLADEAAQEDGGQSAVRPRAVEAADEREYCYLEFAFLVLEFGKFEQGGGRVGPEGEDLLVDTAGLFGFTGVLESLGAEFQEADLVRVAAAQCGEEGQ